MNVQQLITSVKKLPPTPKILPKLKKLLRDGNSSINDILSLIKVDASLAAQIVRVSNSAFYGATSASHSVEEAVNRIGFNEVYKLVAFVASSQALAGGSKLYRLRPGELFHESVTNATIMQHIAITTGEDCDTAYTIGLLHGIGKMLISAWYDNLDRRTKTQLNGVDVTKEWEESQLGFNHATAGAELLRSWKFEEEVATPIESQFTPGMAEEFGHLCTLLCLAKKISSHIQASPKEIFGRSGATNRELTIVRITEQELAYSLIDAKAALQDIKDLITAQ